MPSPARGSPFHSLGITMRASRAIGLVLILSTATAAVLAAPPTVCDLAGSRSGLTMYAVEVAPDQDGNHRIAVDIDGDGSTDTLSWFNPGSGSIIPADNSSATLTLSSTGKSFTVEQQRLHVVKYESKYFVVTGRVESERGPWHREIYAVGRAGITKLCSFTGKGLGQ
jgi:hypothetical protein